MVRAMRRQVWWYRAVVYLSLASLVWGQAVWPISSLVWRGSSDWQPSSAQAAVLTWDADGFSGGAQDGSGTWDTTTANWWDPSLSMNVPWNNTLPDSAVIGAGSGAAGTITVSGTINVAGITFAAPGSGNYTLSGGTLTLTSPTIDVASGLSPTIGSVIAGSVGLTKTGAGTLVLSGTNTFTGGITVTGGVLSVSADGNLNGTNNSILLNGGTLRNTASAQVTPGTITIGSSGGTIDVAASVGTSGPGRDG
ncbi:MAG TPA: autotransporter-associated beta strand repeat-containing protein, partial [Thermoguttaceae bacterium]|nr:autotransporter-associated beta strand repeat-containing protein [Thermoguttaceae bacterium]